MTTNFEITRLQSIPMSLYDSEAECRTPDCLGWVEHDGDFCEDCLAALPDCDWSVA